MTLIVGASAHGSPGVSTALQLVAAAWPSRDAVPVIVEADASGGVLAARYELSLTPGFVTLAESLRKYESPPLVDSAQRLPSGVACVPISPSATAASAQLRSAGPTLGEYLIGSGHPVLLDTGTVLPDSKVSPAMLTADLALWFVRPSREELLVLRHRLAECSQPEQVAVCLVGDKPYNAQQVADGLEVEVLHTLPVDRRGAMAVNLGGDDRFLRRSPLARSCSQLASVLHDRLSTVAPTPPSPAASADLAQQNVADAADGDTADVDTADVDTAERNEEMPAADELTVWTPDQ